MAAILVGADQLAHVFAAGAVAPFCHLGVHKGFEGVGQGDVHGAHAGRIGFLAKFGKNAARACMAVRN